MEESQDQGSHGDTANGPIQPPADGDVQVEGVFLTRSPTLTPFSTQDPENPGDAFLTLLCAFLASALFA